MWYLNNIPTTAHFYWGGEKLSYLRYLSVKSFRSLNPGWKIKIHKPIILGTSVPTWSGSEQIPLSYEEDYTDYLIQLDVEIVEHDFTPEFDNNAHEVHKSDFLRWKILSTEGGLWSDFDILYKLSMNNLKENVMSNHEIDTILCPYKSKGYCHAIGFLLSSANNKFYKFISEQAKKNFDQNYYQSIGATLLNKTEFQNVDSLNSIFIDNKFQFADEKCVYSILYSSINDFFCELRSDLIEKINDSDIIGFHWYAGHRISGNFERQLTSMNSDNFNNILTTIIKTL